MTPNWLKIFTLLIFVSILAFFSTDSRAYITDSFMPRLNAPDYTYGCLINGRLYYRTLGTNVTSTVNGSNPIRILDYRFRFDSRFSIPYTCQAKGAAYQGKLPGNSSINNNTSTATTAIGCTIYSGTDYSMLIDGLNSNIYETNIYSYLPCPLDDYIAFLILPIGVMTFFFLKKLMFDRLVVTSR